MIRIDGVIIGNYRCNLSGADLNRAYRIPSESQHPTVYHLKELIAGFRRSRRIVLAVDFHGHSNKMNSFIYGCHNNDKPDLRFQVLNLHPFAIQP